MNELEYKKKYLMFRLNRPSIGPSFVTHMDQQNNDQSIVNDHFQQHQHADNDLLNAIVQSTRENNQLDCGINPIDSNIQ